MLTYNGDPGKTLEQVYEADRKEYNEVYRPINREMIASTNSREMVDAAKTSANTNFDASGARNRRMAERLGINMNMLEQKETGHRQAASKGLNYDHTVNTARMNQYERNSGIRDEMIAVGRGIDTTAYKMLSESATLQSQREAANTQAAAQAEAQAAGLMGSMASTGMMAGYMVGGPVGAVVGGVGGALFGMF